MTLPPYDRPTSDAWVPAPESGPGHAPAGPRGPPWSRRPRRAARAAARWSPRPSRDCSSSVAQGPRSPRTSPAEEPSPEDVLPVDTLGFVKIDLDPAAGQKMALMSLLAKFPGLDTEGDGDIRGQLMEPLLDLSDADLDYATDVEPWLGDRMAVAVVPSEGTGEPVPVVALAVADEERMAETLTRVQEGTGFGFAVRDDYVLITDSQERADDIAAAERTLVDDPDFAGDREALDGDHIALAWADLSALESIVAAQGGGEQMPAGVFGDSSLSGRMIMGLHAEDDALELVGLDFSVSDLGVPSSAPTRLAQGLPADTAAALSVSGVGDRAAEAWDAAQESGALAELEQPLAELGLELPEDLRTIFGTDLVVAAFGDLEAPAFGARVTTQQPQEAARLLDGVLSSPDIGLAPVFDEAAGGYVVATDRPTLGLLAADGGLGDTDAFQAAVADPDTASAIGFVDLAAVVDRLVAEGGDERRGGRDVLGGRGPRLQRDQHRRGRPVRRPDHDPLTCGARRISRAGRSRGRAPGRCA